MKERESVRARDRVCSTERERECEARGQPRRARASRHTYLQVESLDDAVEHEREL